MIKTIEDLIELLQGLSADFDKHADDAGFDLKNRYLREGMARGFEDAAIHIKELKRNMQQSDVPDNRAEKDRALLVELSRLDTYADEREHEKLVEIIRKHLRENP